MQYLFPRLYDRLEGFLEPAQWAVSLVLVGVIVWAIWALLWMNDVDRTATALWLAFP